MARRFASLSGSGFPDSFHIVMYYSNFPTTHRFFILFPESFTNILIHNILTDDKKYFLCRPFLLCLDKPSRVSAFFRLGLVAKHRHKLSPRLRRRPLPKMTPSTHSITLVFPQTQQTLTDYSSCCLSSIGKSTVTLNQTCARLLVSRILQRCNPSR